jgi:hypothetical protein
MFWASKDADPVISATSGIRVHPRERQVVGRLTLTDCTGDTNSTVVAPRAMHEAAQPRA